MVPTQSCLVFSHEVNVYNFLAPVLLYLCDGPSFAPFPPRPSPSYSPQTLRVLSITSSLALARCNILLLHPAASATAIALTAASLHILTDSSCHIRSQKYCCEKRFRLFGRNLGLCRKSSIAVYSRRLWGFNFNFVWTILFLGH